MNDIGDLFGGVPAILRGETLAGQNAGRSGEGQGAIGADREQARESGCGNAQAGHARTMATSCELDCGYVNASGKVNWCSASCREFGTWGRDL